ncbi:MAG TPA: pyrroline-5-carboxylate reductase [Acidimicrobiales bacterium]|nr:pyrroline-5-carboxylate reductase [Acidimicrobiales bacterium]
MPTKLLVIGGGRIGGALVAGLLGAGWASPDELAVIEPVAARRSELAGAHPGLVVEEQVHPDLVQGAGGAVLAVKPDAAEAACRVLGAAGVGRILSVVAGIPSQRLEAALGGSAVVVRAMPNTPVLVGAGVSAISGGSLARAADLDWAESILAAVGTVVRVPERQLDAVTGVSGSGPAYVFLMVESLIEAGVAAGLSREVSRSLVVETVLGSAKLLAVTGETPERLRADITSPGGTTAAAIRTLEARAVRSAFIEAVAAAVERSRQLAR